MIPIANIYYLLCYAWKHSQDGECVDVGRDAPVGIADLLALVVHKAAVRAKKRGEFRDYVPISEETGNIRGRIDLQASISRLSFRYARLVVHADEFSVDNLLNQVVKATVHRLLWCKELPLERQRELSSLLAHFSGVSNIKLLPAMFAKLQRQSQSGSYRFLLNVCRLVFDMTIPASNGHGWRFLDFTRDERKMAKLFEDFLFGFYQVELRTASVRRETIKWQGSISPANEVYLPEMRTDVSLHFPDRVVLVDAKYYGSTLSSYYGKASLHSSNLYQLFSYVKNYAAQHLGSHVAGMLVYPKVNESLDLSYTLSGHSFRICTVDLTKSQQDIRARLLSITQPGKESAGTYLKLPLGA